MTCDTIVKETTKDGHVRAIIKFSGKWTARAAEDRLAGLPVEDLYEDSGSVFAVGTFLAINVCSDEVYGEILAALDGNPSGHLHKELWNSLVDLDAPYSEARAIAINFFTNELPGATVEALDSTKEPMFSDCHREDMFSICYRGVKFRAELHWDGEKTRIMVFTEGNSTATPSFCIYEEDRNVRKFFDDFVESPKATPETAMFDLMGKIDFSKRIPKATEKKIKGIANLFFQSWLKDASVFGVEASDDIETVKWVEAWFLYKGKKYHLDFCMENGKNTLCLFTTNQYQENVDCTYVTVDTLHEKIDSADDTGHFPENTKMEPGAPEANPREKSMEERLGTVEAAIAVLKEEVAEMKKKL